MAEDSKNLPLSYSALVNLPTPPPRGAKDFIKAYEGWVYAGISTIAKQVSTIDLQLLRKKDGEQLDVEEIHEHESLSLLNHVNDFTTQNQLWEMIQTYLELTGEAYIYKMRGRDGRTDQLWVLRPDWVTVKPSTDKFIDHYIYKAWGMGEGKKLKPENVIPFKFVNPLSPYRGKGSVSAAARAINILTYAEQWNEAFFFNGAMPSMIMTSDGKLDDETVKRWKAKWESQFKGAKNAHKIAFLGGGKWNVHEVSAKIREMDFIELQNNMRDQILGILGVPKVMVGSVEDVNRATAFAAKQIFAENVIKPRMVNIASTLTEFLLPDYEERGQLFYDFADPVPEDREKKRDLYASALEHGWMTINEVRNEEGLPEVEGGNTVYLPFSMQPIGGVGEKIKGIFGKKSEEEQGVITMPVIDKDGKGKRVELNMPIPPKRLREIRDEKLKADIKPDLVKLISNVMKFKSEEDVDSGWTEERKEAFWRQAVARMDVYEERWRDKLMELFGNQKDEVLRNLDNVKYYSKRVRKQADPEDYLFNEEEAIKTWVSIFGPKIRQMLVERGREVLDFLGMPTEIDLTHELAVAFLEQEGIKFIAETNQTTREALRKTLAEGLANEEGINTLKNRVSEVFEQATVSRSEMIARTEVSRSINFATNFSYMQSGVVEAKQWFTAEDERVCPFCNSMNGKVIDVADNFFDRGEQMTADGKTLDFKLYDVMHPPLHPSCRCTLVPITLGEASVETEEQKDDKEKSKVKELEDKIVEKEQELQDIENTAEHLKEQKNKEAEKLVKEAKKKAEQTIKEAKQEKEEIIEEAKNKKAGILSKARDKVRETLYGE